jgi:farnesyl-diphosphate farnesyltransferase
MASANDFCREILPAVSRTFALSIRLLPGDLKNVVRTSYLICRIADTVEDEPTLAAEDKAELFDILSRCFERPEAVAEFTARAASITGDPAHVQLVRHSDLVFTAYRDLSEASRASLRHWAGEMIAGMRKFSLAYPNGVRIQSIDEYREYCYYVAGTVGYLLTDLWHEHSPRVGPREYHVLRERCRAFAEALQTVNILKDVARDAEHENSIYVPQELLRVHGNTHDTMLASNRIAATRRGTGRARPACLARPRRSEGVSPRDSSARGIDQTVLRVAAAVRLRHASRPDAQFRRACATRGSEDLTLRGEITHGIERARRVEQQDVGAAC